MGNSLTPQIYAPPHPPTPLSPDKFFWLETGDAGVGGSDDGNGNGNGGSSRGGSRVVIDDDKREIPVVYIARKNKKAAYHDHNGGSGSGSGSAKSEETPLPAHGKRRFAVLYCHGHDVDLGMTYDFLARMSKLLGVDVMSFDYAGYGLTREDVAEAKQRQQEQQQQRQQQQQFGAGAEDDNATIMSSIMSLGSAYNASANNKVAPSEEQCYNDILACYNYLVVEKCVPPENIILYGKSLGSGPVCWLANKLYREGSASFRKSMKSPSNHHPPPPSPPPIGGIILHSAFLSILRLKIHVGFALPSGDEFCNLERVQEMHNNDCTPGNASNSSSVLGGGHGLPVYLIHGKEDEVVPFEHGKALYELIMDKRGKGFPPFWADGGNHWNVEHKYAIAYIKRLQQFLRYCNKVNNGGRRSDKKQHKAKEKSSGLKGKSRDASKIANKISGRVQTNKTTQGTDAASLMGGNIIMVGRVHAKVAPVDLVAGHHLPNHANVQQVGHQIMDYDVNPRSSSNGRGTMMHHARGVVPSSVRNAKQRKKKGTLVMRGHVQEEGDESEECEIRKIHAFGGGRSNYLNGKFHHHGPKSAKSSSSNDPNGFSSKPISRKMERESRDPSPSLASF